MVISKQLLDFIKYHVSFANLFLNKDYTIYDSLIKFTCPNCYQKIYIDSFVAFYLRKTTKYIGNKNTITIIIDLTNIFKNGFCKVIKVPE